MRPLPLPPTVSAQGACAPSLLPTGQGRERATTSSPLASAPRPGARLLPISPPASFREGRSPRCVVLFFVHSTATFYLLTPATPARRARWPPPSSARTAAAGASRSLFVGLGLAVPANITVLSRLTRPVKQPIVPCLGRRLGTRPGEARRAVPGRAVPACWPYIAPAAGGMHSCHLRLPACLAEMDHGGGHRSPGCRAR